VHFQEDSNACMYYLGTIYSDSQNRVKERDICIHKAIAQA
jgi:hypothetical protein